MNPSWSCQTRAPRRPVGNVTLMTQPTSFSPSMWRSQLSTTYSWMKPLGIAGSASLPASWRSRPWSVRALARSIEGVEVLLASHLRSPLELGMLRACLAAPFAFEADRLSAPL